MPPKGKIVTWNDSKGYGFIAPISGDNQIFIHIKAFQNRTLHPTVGQVITYTVGSDKQGRPCVIKASLEGETLKQNTNAAISIFISTIFFTILILAALEHKISLIIPIVYLVLSIYTYYVYEGDKSASSIGTWRTQESTLHLLALTGGWPGALIAQKKLRHKHKKRSFISVFWITVIINCGLCIGLFSTLGLGLLT